MLNNNQRQKNILHNKMIDRFLNLIIISVFIFCSSVFAQTDLSTKVNLNVYDMKVSDLLDKLHKEYNLNLSFNASDSTFYKRISYKAVSKPMHEVVAEILNLSGHDFKNIDNQIVIYPRSEIPTSKRSNIAPITINSNIPESKFDTVFMDKLIFKTDTLFKTDTIIRYDTIVRYDTISIIKEPEPEKAKNKIKKIRSDVFNNDSRRDNGWAFGISYGKLFADFNVTSLDGDINFAKQVDESEKWTFNSNVLSVSSMHNFNRLKIAAAISYKGITTNFDFSNINTTGGLFEIDTLDTYYTISGIDTSWVYIKDSVWIPMDQVEYKYNQINRLTYLGLQVNMSYSIIHQRNIDLYLQGGLGFDFLLSANGSTITKRTEIDVIDFKDLTFNKTTLSYSLGLGSRFKLNDGYDICPELFYIGHFKDVYQDAAVSKKFRGFGLKIGIIYYL